MVSCYMLLCSVIFTKPCKYFQLNSPYFNRRAGIFSKIELDAYIPAQWRLYQEYTDKVPHLTHFPIFIKPEWGQNASGILRIDNAQDFANWKTQHYSHTNDIRYIAQEAAHGLREYEIFYIRNAHDNDQYAVLTLTESVNQNSHYPINSINNPNTSYMDLTNQYNQETLQKIWALMRQIGDFKIARVSVKTDDIHQLIEGHFKVVEVNIFIPMPINLLDKRYHFWQIIKMASQYMYALAKITKTRDKSLPEKPIFTKIMLYNRQNQFLNYINTRL